MPRLLSVALTLTLMFAPLAATVAQPPAKLPPPVARTVDFVTEVRPILARACFACHGPEKQRGGLRLDVKADALAGGDNGPVLLPKQSEKSPLIRYVAHVESPRMPPDPKQRLSDAEIGILRAWIDQGVNWPDSASAVKADPRDWWSFKPLRRPTPPQLNAADARWVRHPIDAFILAKLREKGLAPSPEADRRTLIRRVTFDLIGLPPTPEQIDAFVRDPDPLAYEKWVDHLLQSPQYGERWARHWLDVVHYGDTHGYDKDQPRPNAWPYRDYVIRSLNADKPYARFVQEQIAGDVLFPQAEGAIEALGFIAAGPWDLIGHAEVPEEKIDGQIARHLDRDDMIVNVANTFLSVTLQCAQCHNHKFDPISQEDYYAMQAVFAALDRADRPYHADPTITARYVALQARQRQLNEQRQQLEANLAQQIGRDWLTLSEQLRQLATAPPAGQRPEFGYHSAIANDPHVVKWVQIDLGQSQPIDKIVFVGCHDTFNQIGAGFGFPVRYKIEASDDPQFRSGVVLLLDHTEADVPNPGVEPQSVAVAGRSARYVRVTATKLALRQNDYIFALAELMVFDAAGKNLALGKTVTALDSIEAPVRWRRSNLVDGYHYNPAAATEDRAELLRQRERLIQQRASAATRQAWREVQTESECVAAELALLPAPSYVYAGTIHTGSGAFRGTGANGGRPRPVYVLARGDVKKPGKLAQPGALSAVSALPARFALPAEHHEGDRRAALALWLTHPEHPLTWRSIVNRVWRYHMGRGIVETPNDFGRMGQLPTHPELLDWLAIEFRDQGGSLKQLHRWIVTSSTYRQVSTGNAAMERYDSNNAYYWRMNRRRLEAEAIRDSVLLVSGKLDRKMYGPGFRDFVIEKPEHSPHYQYHLHDPADPRCHRRSIYRFIVRSQQQPFMTTLDCADPSMQVDRRNETLSPLQALALLNNGFMLTMAKAFAERLEQQSGDPVEQVRWAMLWTVGRPPRENELQALVDYRRQYGLANLCRLIFNLNEFAFVD